jgi:hypothetical protein
MAELAGARAGAGATVGGSELGGHSTRKPASSIQKPPGRSGAGSGRWLRRVQAGASVTSTSAITSNVRRALSRAGVGDVRRALSRAGVGDVRRALSRAGVDDVRRALSRAGVDDAGVGLRAGVRADIDERVCTRMHELGMVRGSISAGGSGPGRSGTAAPEEEEESEREKRDERRAWTARRRE